MQRPIWPDYGHRQTAWNDWSEEWSYLALPGLVCRLHGAIFALCVYVISSMFSRDRLLRARAVAPVGEGPDDPDLESAAGSRQRLELRGQWRALCSLCSPCSPEPLQAQRSEKAWTQSSSIFPKLVTRLILQARNCKRAESSPAEAMDDLDHTGQGI